MVDCELVNIEKISNEERVKIINYVMEKKGVKARDLEVTINLISMIRSGKRRVTEDLLCRALKFLSNEELAKLLGQIPEVVYIVPKGLLGNALKSLGFDKIL